MTGAGQFIKQSIGLLPPVRRLRQQRDQLARSLGIAQAEIERLKTEASVRAQAVGEVPWVPNGHFYSPIAARQEVDAFCATALDALPRSVADVDLREADQLKFVEAAREFYADLPFEDHPREGLRYHYMNPAFGHGDGIILNSMIRHARPKRVVEVGSGHSSCMLLDTNEMWFDHSISCSFIEPYPELLYSLLKPDDLGRIKIYPSRVQDTPLSIFESLAANDILFIDSTHVSKVGSDVNHILFNILPTLAPGVIIHFHDIIYPFEYPKHWLEEGRAWNEAYLLRAFLMSNKNYEIVMFNSFMSHFHKDYMDAHMPLCQRNSGGSIWLRKIA